jgi:hypothetical protein
MLSAIIGVVIGLILGFLGGAGTMKDTYKHSKVGKLRMDDSTEDTYLFLELHVPVETVLQQKECLLEVDLTPLTRE